MKHTDFYSLHKKLDEQAREELVAAIKAHGQEYVFIHIDEDEEYIPEEIFGAPIIAAAIQCMDGYMDFRIVRVVLDENDSPILYGFPTESIGDECELSSVAHGHLEYIIDEIPETESVQDVTVPCHNLKNS